MPYSSNEELPKGVKGLPAGQQTKWRKVFNSAYEGTCKDRSDRDECASKIAWSQISDKYKGKTSPLTEFSMVIKSATHDKQKDTLRWKAVASDTDEDYYHDNMSLELFDDFQKRISIKELAPEEFRTSFWKGGLPYVSVSHYPDLEGEAVPGSVETVFVDGNQLRSYGQFNKTPIGLACYHSICTDLYTEPKKENPIRISIAFLDWSHTHKSNGFEFERENIDDICPECVMEHIRGKFSGKIFRKGQLVHLALTRVPANERTSMEVEKSMTTRKEDAASIIGEELADEIDEKAKLVGKSQALIIKTDTDDDEAEEVENSEEEYEVSAELEPVVEEAKTEKKPDPKEDEDEEDEEKEEHPKGKKKPMKSVVEERLDAIEKMISNISVPAAVPEVVSEHELDVVFAQFKSAFDEIKSQPFSADEKLRMLQDHFNEFGNEVISRMKTDEDGQEETVEASPDLVQSLSLALSEALKPLSDKLDLVLTQRSEMVKSNVAVPDRRSVAPTLSMQSDIHKSKAAPAKSSSVTPKLQQIVRRTVGIQ